MKSFEISKLTNHRLFDLIVANMTLPEPVAEGNSVEILRSGLVISGFAAFHLAQQAGRKTITCKIREDLDGDEPAIEHRLLEDLLSGYSLDKLNLAALYVRSKELAWSHKATRDLPGTLAKVAQVSTRSLQRWANVIAAPEAVQKAWLTGKLDLRFAERVAFLGSYEVEQIEQRIAGGEEVQSVIAEYTQPPPKDPVKPRTDIRRLCKALTAAHASLHNRLDEVDLIPAETVVLAISEGRDLLDRLLKRFDRNRTGRQPSLDEVKRRVQRTSQSDKR